MNDRCTLQSLVSIACVGVWLVSRLELGRSFTSGSGFSKLERCQQNILCSSMRSKLAVVVLLVENILVTQSVMKTTRITPEL